MNSDFAPVGISFNLVDIIRTVNVQWASSSNDFEMKSALRRGSYADLNIYFLTNFDNTNGFGFCYLPTNPTQEQFILDGCTIDSATLPGGSAINLNLGAIATHEAGHFLGLFHVFQGDSCFGPGDFVFDTPQQSTPSMGCPVNKDSCPGVPGLDSINNHMDYTDDFYRNSFTNGQRDLMFAVYDQFRAGR